MSAVLPVALDCVCAEPVHLDGQWTVLNVTLYNEHQGHNAPFSKAHQPQPHMHARRHSLALANNKYIYCVKTGSVR